jgi:hypothetical protein
VTAVRMAKARRLGVRELVRPYRGPRVGAVRARDDPGPALAIVGWLGARAVEKVRA